MDDHKMEIIKQLMDELQSAMGHSPDDLSERLGRPKPDVGMISIEAKPDDGSDPDDDSGMDDDSSDDSSMMDDPEEKLKQRLLKLRG